MQQIKHHLYIQRGMKHKLTIQEQISLCFAFV